MEVYGVCVLLMIEKAIWLDIARVCGRIFMSRRQVKIQHKTFSPINTTLVLGST